ncbi:redoxin domain-containing protein, partial [Microbacterium sp. Bi128]|uniref:redoxin domain-containing protein n=1 Tax=Microbacterium sp. Bi128 TaxID=2821115 RepID=UPI0035AB91BB
MTQAVQHEASGPGSAVSPVPGVGDAAPDFELANQFGEPVRLSDFRGRNVAIVFYPFAFSGICTGE